MKRRILLLSLILCAVFGTAALAQCVSMDSAFYTYDQLLSDVDALCSQYEGMIECASLGRTADDREILALRIGNPEAEHRFVIQATIHAREYINSLIAMLQIEDLLEELSVETPNLDINAFCLYMIPMSNPDGVSISQYGIDAIRNEDLKSALRRIYDREGGGKSYWKKWKANAEGVDLNRNFDQYWDEFVGSSRPSSEKYKGESPACAAETQAILGLIESVDPQCVISYHSSGDLIYWDYGCSGDVWNRNYELASVVSIVTDYPMRASHLEGQDSAGCSDYMVLTQKRAAVTIENGSGSCPLGDDAIKPIWRANRYLLPALLRHYTSPVHATGEYMGTLLVTNCKEYVSLRAQPDKDSDVLKKVPLNARVEGYFFNSEFVECYYGGCHGYILSEYLYNESSAAADESDDYIGECRIINCNEYVTLRSEPSTKASALAHVPLGDKVECYSRSGDFTVCYYNGLRGYILSKYLSQPVSGDAAADDRLGKLTVINCNEYVSLRASPSTSADRIVKVPLGAEVEACGYSGEFTECYYQDYHGYILSRYLG